MTAQLEGRGHSWRFSDAIDGRRGLPEACERMVDRAGSKVRVGRPMADGEFACALSHLLTYRAILESGLPGAIVLEDDVVLTPVFDAFLDQRAYESAPLVLLDHSLARVRRFRQPGAFDGFHTYRLARNPLRATAYSISREAAAHILERALPVRCVADWPCEIWRLGASITMPRLVELGPTEESMLETERNRLEAMYPGVRGLKRYTRAAYLNRWWIKRTTWRAS
jgi:glycosyl transferase family 25